MLTVLAIAFAIFLLGNLARVVRIVRMPVPLRWELYPVPKGPRERQRYGGSYFEETDWWTKPQRECRFSQAAFVLREVLTLHSVLAGFRALWLWSLLLHWGMYLYITAVALSLFTATAPVSPFVAQVGCSIGFMGALGLFLLRARNERLREYSSRASMFNLVLLGVLFASGMAALVGTASLGEVLRNRGNTVVPVHLAVVALFLVYFPFTHMTHAYMKFFTWDRVRWNDAPGPASDLAKSLKSGSGWIAPHISGGEKQTWAEIVSDTAGRGSGKRD